MRLNHAIKVVLLAGFLCGCGREQRERLPEPRTNFYEISPDTVTEVLLSTGRYKLLAFRWTPADPFQIAVSHRGRVIEQCVGGTGFLTWLAGMTRMSVVKQLDRPFGTESPDWGDMRLRDNTQQEPIDVRFRSPASASEPVVIEVGMRQFAVGLDARLLATDALSCAAFRP